MHQQMPMSPHQKLEFLHVATCQRELSHFLKVMKVQMKLQEMLVFQKKYMQVTEVSQGLQLRIKEMVSQESPRNREVVMGNQSVIHVSKNLLKRA